MEIYNPILELSWIIGVWQGINQSTSEKKEDVTLIVSKYGDETIKFSFLESYQGKARAFEELYLLYDKTREQLVAMVFNVEGYYEKHIVSLTRKKLILEFQMGINLPPNISIIRTFEYYPKKFELIYRVFVGKNKIELSHILFSKVLE